MKLKKKNYIHLAILFLAYTVLVIAITRFTYVYGSKLDWSSQHYAIPDYLRKLFYSTGDLFPSLALNIGGGENIYNLSYYGLFSPIILFSYLLPFVKMSVYIQAVSYLGVIVSTYIFYRWMMKKFGDNLAFILSIAFMFAGPLILHSHRHIMFVSYMPFLLLSLMAVEDYMAGKKKYKMVLFPFLMTMTCYFFAVSGLCAVTVYAVYYYLKINDKFVFKEFLKKGIHYAGRIVTAVLMACVLLLPTVYCLMSGRDKAHVKIDFSTLIPSANVKYFMFGSYSAGLGIFVICAIICAILCKQKHRRFIGIVMALILICPIFVYILNGTLYIDAKVLIPFMPLLVIMIGQAYNDITDNNFKWKIVLPITVLYVVISLITEKTTAILNSALISDTIVMIICMALYYWKHKRIFINISVCGVLVVAAIAINSYDKLLPIDVIKTVDDKYISALCDVISEDESLVRTSNYVDVLETVNFIYNDDYLCSNIYSSLHNKHYNDFYFKQIKNENEFRNSALTTQSQSILYSIYMGQKYLINETAYTNVPTGYSKVSESGKYSLYENDSVLPLGYASDRTMSVEQFEKLEYPYSVEALLNYTICEGGDEDSCSSQIKEISPLEFVSDNGITFDNGVYTIDSKKTIAEKIKLSETLTKDKILLVSFDIDNDLKGKQNDSRVTLNGIKNTLTTPSWKYYNNNTSFEYTITCDDKDSISEINAVFSAGHYKISNLKCYVMDYPECAENVDEFKIDKSSTKGDVINGTIDVSADGMFNISIPYSDGFEISVDGEKVQPEMTDTAFVGFEISKGQHEISIRFTSPLQHIGMICSGTGIVIFVLLIIFEKRKNKKA